jgi:hypothetical protein
MNNKLIMNNKPITVKAEETGTYKITSDDLEITTTSPVKALEQAHHLSCLYNTEWEFDSFESAFVVATQALQCVKNSGLNELKSLALIISSYIGVEEKRKECTSVMKCILQNRCYEIKKDYTTEIRSVQK